MDPQQIFVFVALAALILGVGTIIIYLLLRVFNASIFINPLWWFGVLLAILVGLRIYFGIPVPLATLAAWAGGAALALAFMSVHNTPTQNKSIMLAFGDRRVRAGPRRNGYTEGLNIPWLPWPFSRLKDTPTPEFRVDFNNPSAYTAENVPVKVDGYAMFEIDDAYRAEGVEDLRNSARVFAVGVVREITDEFTVKELQQAEHRDRLSKMIVAGIRDKLVEGDTEETSSNVRSLMVKRAEVVEVDVPEKVKAANTQKYVEPIEGDLEKIQLNNRLEQVEAYKAKGVKPDAALAATLVDAGKSGASVNSTTITGLDGVGNELGAGLRIGLTNLGKGLSDFAKTKRGTNDNG